MKGERKARRPFRRFRAFVPVRSFVLAASLALGACHADGPIERAESHVRRNESDRAVQVLVAHLASHPDDLAARRMLVRVYAWSGNLGAAKHEVEELERRLPNDPVPWIELGHAFELTHRFDEALEAYDAASEVAPRSPAGPREGGMRAARWGEIDEARSRLEEAVRRGANDAEIWHALGLVRLHERDYEGATDAYERGLRADPNRTDNLLGLASVAVVTDDPTRALAAYERLLAKEPRYAPAELGRAWALGKLGRTSEALRALERAQELGASPSHVEKQRAALKAK